MSNNGFPTISNDKSSSYSNLDKDLVLSPADMGKTVFIDSTNGNYIVLPDARLLTIPLLSIKNNGTTPVGVLDNNGIVIGGIDAGESYILTCTDRTSSSGAWEFNLVGVNRSTLSSSSLSSTGGASPGQPSICMMTSTTGLVFYCSGGGTPNYYPYITPFTIVNSAISFGTTQAAGTMPQASSGSYGIVRLSPTTAFAYLGSSSPIGYPCGCIVTMSGLSLSFSTPTNLASTTMNLAQCCKISDGKLVIVYTALSGSYGYSQVIMISGTTITTGALATVYSGITAGISICKISQNLCAVSYSPSTGNLYAVTLSISGTTITVNSATSLATLANGINGSSIVYMKSGLIGVLYQLAFAVGTKITTATLSGTTLTLGTTLVLDSVTNSPAGYCKMIVVNKTTVLAVYLKNTPVVFRKITISSNNLMIADTETQVDGNSYNLDISPCSGQLTIVATWTNAPIRACCLNFK